MRREGVDELKGDKYRGVIVNRYNLLVWVRSAPQQNGGGQMGFNVRKGFCNFFGGPCRAHLPSTVGDEKSEICKKT